jgi:hypothetical protein
LHFIPRSHPSWCGAIVGGGDGGEADGGEADGGDGDVGVARLEGSGDVGGADVTNRGNTTGMAAQAGDNTMWGGDTGSLGSEGVMGRGEDAPSHGNVGFEGGETDIDVGAVGCEGSGSLTDGGVAERTEVRGLIRSPPRGPGVVPLYLAVVWIFLLVAVGSQAREWSVMQVAAER